MARRAKTSAHPTKPLVKAPMQIGRLDAPAIVGELRRIHEEAEDPQVERMPGDEELFGALLYAEKHAKALRSLPIEVQRVAALQRVRLWEYLREQTEKHQARAIDDARTAGVQWAVLAPALAVGAPNAAYNKAKRLKADDFTDGTPQARRVRRTPEAVLLAQHRRILEQAQERRIQESAQRHHAHLVPVATRLLAQRDALVRDDDVDYWLEEMEAVLTQCRTPLQKASLNRYFDAAMRAVARLENSRGHSAALTDEARATLAEALDLQQRHAVGH
ncbi:hypothetical protein ACIQB5_50915 [Streptomyces sp. NPDC088560]|uniref:hypothetical protein n=1 Tax=Streptomyces sp. NPDC088560 TaxID=3365868 RepID=UPI003828EB84